jgi:hypothetical protein
VFHSGLLLALRSIGVRTLSTAAVTEWLLAAGPAQVLIRARLLLETIEGFCTVFDSVYGTDTRLIFMHERAWLPF